MKDWFYKLEQREQMLVSIAAVLGILTLIITLGVRPIANNMSRGQELVEDKRALLLDIERVAERIGPQKSANSATPGDPSQSLVVIVDRSTRTSGLAPYLKRNQPDGSDDIRIRFESVPFDEVVTWLGIMQTQHGLITTTANIDKAGLPGRVNCNLTLSRG